MKLPVSLTCLLLGTLAVQAQELPHKSVSIFKNQQAFIIKEGSVNTQEGKYVITDNFPKAYLGTFWLYNGSNGINYITSQRDSISKQVVPSSIPEVLVSNKGKRVLLKVQEGDNAIAVDGIIEEIRAGQYNPQTRSMIEHPANVVIIKTKDSWYSTAVSRIISVQQYEKPGTLELKDEMHALSIHFKDAGKKQQDLGMMYLASGLAWSPIYWVELEGSGKARLVLNAEVSNDAEDLMNTQLNFVAGVPQFSHNGQLSMLLRFLGQDDINTLERYQTFSNSVFSRGNMYQAEKAESAMDVEVSGQGVQDMFYYTVKNVSLRKGGNASFEILRGDLDVKHEYRAVLNGNSYYGEISPSRSTVNHYICFANSLGFPLTSAPVFISEMNGKTRLPVGQSSITYTAVKGSNEILIGNAIDVEVRQEEKETGRQSTGKVWNNERYTFVTIQAVVTVINRKKEALEVDLQRTIYGEIKDNKAGFKMSPVPSGSSLNRQQQLRLKTTLKPGEEKTITYTYEVYVRS